MVAVQQTWPAEILAGSCASSSSQSTPPMYSSHLELLCQGQDTSSFKGLLYEDINQRTAHKWDKLLPVHECPYCQYRSKSVHNLDRHLKRHTGEKPFACTYCNYKSISKQHVIRHALSRHPESVNTQTQ